MKQLSDARLRANIERLRDYYGTEGQLTGIRSIHGPLVDMALSGGGAGARKQDGSINDRRFAWGAMRNATAGKETETKFGGLAETHRLVRAALARLDTGHSTVLAAAYGEQRRWHPQVRRVLLATLPDHYATSFGAAILHERVQQGLGNPRELADDIDESVLVSDDSLTKKAKREARTRAVTGVIVWCPPQSAFRRGTEERSAVERVADETCASLDAAHIDFAREFAAVMKVARPASPKPRVKRKIEDPLVERVYPFGIGDL